VTSVLLAPDLPLEHWPSMDRYASRLVLGLRDAAPNIEVTLAHPIGGLTTEGGVPAGGRASDPTLARLPPVRLGEVHRYYRRYRTYPARVRRAAGDVLHVLDHSYAHLLLGRGTRPAVVTVHDLLPLITVRRRGSGLRNRIRDRLLGRVLDGLRQADAWIASTEWLRTDLAEWLGRDERIHVIPYGVDEGFFRTSEANREATRKQWGLPPEAFVVLHVGSVGERKNVPTLLESLRGLRDLGLKAWLLQVGGAFTQEQRARIRAAGLEEFVRATGPVGETVLRAAYRAADALQFPSLYEGFGFPVLEAMASGLPVVTSGAGGLAEAAGDAAVMVSERTTEPYVEALKRIAEDGEWRDTLVARGRSHAQRFRWSETARLTAEVYRSLV
jgi:glycosyltransferase involved in cell wall biosynthesis